MASYESLSRARLTYEYLHTNSTTHEFLFGALAELVDNSRDAGATKTHIYTVANETTRGKFILCFLDNGCGMDQTEVSQVIQFGRSAKRHANSNLIGQYGNGLKSGSMRIGKDMLLFTKKNDVLSCLFLSRTFHERERLQEVVVPMPSWNASSGHAAATNEAERRKHKTEVDIITRFSPFKSEEELLAQFKDIKASGTLIMVFNVKLMDNGEPELDVTQDQYDIGMADSHADEVYDVEENVLPERVSFRAYVSVLYSEPRMKIYIQGKKVRTRRLVSSLCKPRTYHYSSTRFKKRSEQEVEKAEREAVAAEEKCKEMLIQLREQQQNTGHLSKAARSKVQIAERNYEDAKQQADYKRLQADGKKKSLKEPKTLSFTFGFNLERRRCCGMFIYNCNRLIRMYERVGPQMDGGVKCAGIVGVVDVPYLVLEPTHNKQDFADHKEYKHLLKSMADHMVQYWKDCKIESFGVTRFWETYGYTGSWRDDPSDERRFLLKRLMDVPGTVQCDSCLKWRELKFSKKMLDVVIPDSWTCSSNTDPNFRSCSKPEQKVIIPIGKMQRPIKNLDEKKAEEIKRLKEKLEKAEEHVNLYQKPSSPPIRSSGVTTKSRPTSLNTTPVVADRKVRRHEQATAPSYTQAPPPQARQRPQVDRAKTNSIKVETQGSNKLTKPVSANKRVKRKRLNSSESHDDDDDVEETPSKRQRETKVTSTTKGSPQPLLSPDDDEVAASPPSPQETLRYEPNAPVEVKVNDRWYSGSVAVVKHLGQSRGSQVKVKFNNQLGPDRWFAQSDPNLRLRSDVSATPSPPTTPIIADATSRNKKTARDQQRAIVQSESPSTTMKDDGVPATLVAADSSNHQDDTLHAVSDLLRQCLCYFRAPDFVMDQDTILSLTPTQLKSFPLTKFTEDYERKIRQLVGSQDTTRDKLKEAEDMKASLSRANSDYQQHVNKLERDLKSTRESLQAVRGDVNFLIRNLLTEKGNLEESDRTSHVDNLLEAIVAQIKSENN